MSPGSSFRTSLPSPSSAAASTAPSLGLSASVAQCTSDELALNTDFPMQGATGNQVGDVAIRNTSPIDCEYPGDALVTLLDADGVAVASSAGQAPQAPLLLPAHSSAPAYLLLEWGNWCQSNPGPLIVRIQLPHDGLLTGNLGGSKAAPSALPRCDEASSPSHVSLTN